MAKKTQEKIDAKADTERRKVEFVQVLTFKCVKCGQIVHVEEEPDICVNALCSTNRVPLEQKRVDEAALIKKHNIARLEGKLRRKEITKAEFDDKMKAIG